MLATEDVVTLAWETQKAHFPIACPTNVLICLKELIRHLKREFIFSNRSNNLPARVSMGLNHFTIDLSSLHRSLLPLDFLEDRLIKLH
jgi:hypothetical protein